MRRARVPRAGVLTGRAEAVPGVAARAVGAGPFRTCALTTEGGVVCWGDNEHGSSGADASTRTAGVTVIRRAAEPSSPG